MTFLIATEHTIQIKAFFHKARPQYVAWHLHFEDYVHNVTFTDNHCN